MLKKKTTATSRETQPEASQVQNHLVFGTMGRRSLPYQFIVTTLTGIVTALHAYVTVLSPPSATSAPRCHPPTSPMSPSYRLARPPRLHVVTVLHAYVTILSPPSATSAPRCHRPTNPMSPSYHLVPPPRLHIVTVLQAYVTILQVNFLCLCALRAQRQTLLGVLPLPRQRLCQ